MQERPKEESAREAVTGSARFELAECKDHKIWSRRSGKRIRMWL